MESEKEIEDKGLFQVVLDDDEEVVQVIRPHKGRAWFGTIFTFVVLTLVIVPFAIMMMVFRQQGDGDSLGAGIGALVFWALISTLGFVATALWSCKTVYAWTNKRVLIRTGYIGVDYKSLDLNMVGALSVNVTMVDKLLRRNTGTIAFGSMASPMTTQNASKFNFAFVYDPYRVYKEVKGYIDQKKSAQVAK